MMAMMTKLPQPGEAPSEEAILAMHEFNEELQKAGVLVDMGGLTPPEMGARVHYTKKTCKVIDGPFAESKEVVAGFSMLEVKSLAEAIEIAKRAPFGATVKDGEEAIVEIRPLFDPSMYDPK